MRDRDRFLGCLAGGAAGDALGYAVEFYDEKWIFKKYGERGITGYQRQGDAALISDDTQMALFTAVGLLCAGAQSGGEDCPAHINRAYLCWYRTQMERYPLPGKEHAAWLANVPGLFQWRAPGNTCMAALQYGGGGSTLRPINNSKGCGGVMRVAPIGLYFNDRGKDVREIFRLGAEAAALTHGHPLAWMPSGVLTGIIHEVSQDGASLSAATDHALEIMEEIWPDTGDRRILAGLIRKARDLACSDRADLAAIHLLGEGWTGEEALAIALYCALKYPEDIDRALIAAVNHKGDSDSTGAVAGNLLGASLGYSRIPEKYTRDLELLDLILEVAEDLWRDLRDPGDPEWERKYLRGSFVPGESAP